MILCEKALYFKSKEFKLSSLNPFNSIQEISMLFQKSKKQGGYLVSRSLFCYIISDSELRAAVEKVYGDHTDDVITAFTKAYLEKNVLDLLSIDRAMREASVRVAKLFAQGSGKAYLYNFIFEFPFHHGKTAWNCADIPFFFGNTELVESRRWRRNSKMKSSGHCCILHGQENRERRSCHGRQSHRWMFRR